MWLSWVCVEQSSFITIFFYDFSMVELGLWLVPGLCLSWVCGWASLCWAISFITIFFYDFSVFDFWVCMIFLGLCSCVFCHFGILNSFFSVCFCVLCVFKFEFVFGSGFVFVFFVFLLFLILFFLYFLVKIDKLFFLKNRCWCDIFYNILIPPAATSTISVGWLTKKMKITHVN